jgi:flagellar biogenesis protein FliO
VWFREFGLSLANMALIGFLTILILLLVRVPGQTGHASGHLDVRARNGALLVKNRTVIIVVGVIVLVLGLAGAPCCERRRRELGGCARSRRDDAPPTATTCRRTVRSR